MLEKPLGKEALYEKMEESESFPVASAGRSIGPVDSFPGHSAHRAEGDEGAPQNLGDQTGRLHPESDSHLRQTKDAKKDILKLAGDVRASVLHENTHFDMFLFSFLTDTDAAAALKQINKKYAGLYSASRNWKFGIPPTPVSPQKIQGGTAVPQHVTNDPGAKASWWLQKIKEPNSGNPLAADKNIAIIDTGVDYTHSELEGKAFSVFDYVNWDADAMDDHGHGTHCAGIAAAKAANASGIHGVSPLSKIYAYKVLDRTGSGGWYQIMTAITDAADNPNVSILSLSLGGGMISGSRLYHLEAAVATPGDKGNCLCRRG
jgi:subtilisin family serine protease